MNKEQFKKHREELGMTQSELAAVLGLNSDRAIRAYETGERSISGMTAAFMQFLINVSGRS